MKSTEIYKPNSIESKIPELRKCSRCRCNMMLSYFDANKNSGLLKKTCRKCLEKQKKSNICPHGRRRSQCKECGGGHICEHNRRRSRCKECGGSEICEHGRQRSRCKECGGSQVCEHGRRRSQCKECGGSEICEHGRRRSQCKECGGSEICEHNRIRNTCKQCMNDEQKIEFIQKRMISSSRSDDKKKDRYDPDNFIDKCFLEGLFEDLQNCHYCDVEFTYNEKCDTFVTIERLNNSIGHIKSNCVLACWDCNHRHQSRE